jgi:DNA-binding transcriptional ArsR family regulator
VTSFALDPEKARRVVVLLKAAAHPTRLELLALLRSGDTNVGQLATSLSMPQAMVSSQLAILRMTGLVDVRREGGFAWYRLNRARLSEALDCLGDTAEPKDDGVGQEGEWASS